jgi:hypothetical protein
MKSGPTWCCRHLASVQTDTRNRKAACFGVRSWSATGAREIDVCEVEDSVLPLVAFCWEGKAVVGMLAEGASSVGIGLFRGAPLNDWG